MNAVIKITPEHGFTKVRLGDIKPNRFRRLDLWPVDPTVIESLKLSINERGFWANLRAVINEHDEIELCYGHHRLAAGLELYGPDYEIALQISPFEGEWALQRDMQMENSVNRNKVAHTHEVVYTLTHWLDDEVFARYPTWEDCLAAGVFTSGQLEAFFGPEGNQHGQAEGAGGPGAYAKCVQTGVGRNVIAKMLEGTESSDAIKQALQNLTMGERTEKGFTLAGPGLQVFVRA